MWTKDLQIATKTSQIGAVFIVLEGNNNRGKCQILPQELVKILNGVKHTLTP